MEEMFIMADEIRITQDGFDKMMEELTELKTIKRTQISEAIRVAREFGDLSENSEYNEAKDEQARIEGRISELEEKLKNVRVVSKDELSTDTVGIGSIVTIIDDGMEFDYKLVSGAEDVGAGENSITDSSPVGKALMGKRVGDVVTVDAPAGSFEITVLKIRV